ncbi:MAG: sigma-70 family RNA polymerase sigma factor [Anaerolineales bacterium]|nr:sigma-70 family RNA polymerase sigma factor [Anaerolineales bacterium]
MSEADWVRRARAGDDAAFSLLLETYQSPIYNLCYRLLGEAGEAEDAAQEAFLRAYAQLASYDPGRPFKTWLFAIANHHCIDRLRKRRLTWLSIDDDLPPHPALQEQAPGPEEALVRREQSEMLQVMLARLPPDDRSVIVMRYWYDFSYEEIAEATRTTVSAVKSRLHRARNSLGEMLPGAARAPRPAARSVLPAQG